MKNRKSVNGKGSWAFVLFPGRQCYCWVLQLEGTLAVMTATGNRIKKGKPMHLTMPQGKHVQIPDSPDPRLMMEECLHNQVAEYKWGQMHGTKVS